MDNYRLSRDRAQEYFLTFDQEPVIARWALSHDAQWLYVNFLGRPYRICRKTAAVTRLWSQQEAEYGEVLSIFDLLCHTGEAKYCSGRFAPVNSLKGRPPIGVASSFYTETAAQFDRDPDGFRRACLALGGTPMDLGDMGFQFPVFRDLTVQLKFYHRDEDFPASITLLWDENMLQFVFYETVFYIAGVLLDAILSQMRADSL